VNAGVTAVVVLCRWFAAARSRDKLTRAEPRIDIGAAPGELEGPSSKVRHIHAALRRAQRAIATVPPLPTARRARSAG